jgi:hypothetical protein
MNVTDDILTIVYRALINAGHDQQYAIGIVTELGNQRAELSRLREAVGNSSQVAVLAAGFADMLHRHEREREARAENAKLREELELLRAQLSYWKEREDADPLPFCDDTEVSYDGPAKG